VRAPDSPPAAGSHRPAPPAAGALLAFGSYLAVVVVLAFPLITRLGTVVSSDLGDPVLNAWILWQNATTLPFTDAWWSPAVLHPTPNVLAYSEHLFGISLLSTPVYWLTGSPVIAYNVAFLLTFPLSGLAAYLLGMELTGRRDAAWLGGLAFAFAPYRMDQLAHLQVLASFWMPLGLFALHRYYRRGGRRWLALFGVATLLNGLTNGYYLLFYPPLVLIWVLWFTPRRGWWRRAGLVASVGALVMLLVLPILMRYQRVHDEVGLTRTREEIRAYSADAGGILSMPPRLAGWRGPEALFRPEGQLFPGATAVLLVLAALGSARWRRGDPEPAVLAAARRAVGAISLLYAAGVALRLVHGPWRIPMPGFVISAVDLDKILAQAVLFWFLSALLSPAVVGAYRRRSPLAFYAVAAFLMYVLALGPEPHLLEQPLMAHSAYKALTWLPGFDALRVPARFWMLGTICVAALVTLSFALLVTAGSRRRAPALALVAVGLLVDGWVVWPTAPLPPPSAVIAGIDGGLLELPLEGSHNDTLSMLRATVHRQPLVNGFSGYAPRHYWALRFGLERHQTATLDLLAGLGIRFVRVDRSLDRDGAHERYVAGHPDARLAAETATEALYRLAPRPDPRRTPRYGAPIPVVALTATANAHLVPHLRDGSLDTRWEGGPQRPDQRLRLDIGAVRRVGAVVTKLGPYLRDFPRTLLVELSVDGTEWVEAWRGPTDGLAVVGSILAPREVPILVPLAGQRARYIRLVSLAEDPIYSWSIAELEVLSPPSSPW